MGEQSTLIQVLDFGIGMQTHLHFVAYAMHIHMNNSWSFECKGSFEVRKHETKIGFFAFAGMTSLFLWLI
jgi:hypothetical protein